MSSPFPRPCFAGLSLPCIEGLTQAQEMFLIVELVRCSLRLGRCFLTVELVRGSLRLRRFFLIVELVRGSLRFERCSSLLS